MTLPVIAPAAASGAPLPGPLRWGWRALARGQAAGPVARDWLAAQLGVAPPALNLEREARGRPRLGAPQGGFDCSWSHSGEGLLIALGTGVRLGVDCERVHARPRALELAQRFFTAAEHAWLASHSAGSTRDLAFLRLWCAKEAVLKAHGHGLAFGLHRLRFAATAEGLVLAECDPGLGPAAAWSLHEFTPAAGYIAAVAWRPAPSDMA